MACRIVNLHSQPLRVDLRGGEFLLLAPGGRSKALREEALYDNPHLVDWERAGWLRRIPARLRDVLAEKSAPRPALLPAPAKVRRKKAKPAKAAPPRATKATGKRAAAKQSPRRSTKR